MPWKREEKVKVLLQSKPPRLREVKEAIYKEMIKKLKERYGKVSIRSTRGSTCVVTSI